MGKIVATEYISARVGVPLVSIGQPVRPPVAEECDAPVATAVMPAGVWL